MASKKHQPGSSQHPWLRPVIVSLLCNHKCDYIAMMFDVEFDADASDELDGLRSVDQRKIVTEIRKQLRSEPTHETRNRKLLRGVSPPWDQVGPVWELRVGEFRVFYDVLDDANLVIIRAIRHKGTKTTEEIL
jgi:mRNA-degrading endonuclease RelE of RelBE toxin-antitoxin system